MLSTPPPIAASGVFVDDHVRRHGDGLEARRAKAVDRGAGNGHRQPRANGRHAGHVHPLLTLRIAAAENHVVDLGRIERGTLPSTWRRQWATRSSGRVILNDPRNDFASGVRELATTTASLMAESPRGMTA